MFISKCSWTCPKRSKSASKVHAPFFCGTSSCPQFNSGVTLITGSQSNSRNSVSKPWFPQLSPQSSNHHTSQPHPILHALFYCCCLRNYLYFRDPPPPLNKIPNYNLGLLPRNPWPPPPSLGKIPKLYRLFYLRATLRWIPKSLLEYIAHMDKRNIDLCNLCYLCR